MGFFYAVLLVLLALNIFWWGIVLIFGGPILLGRATEKYPDLIPWVIIFAVGIVLLLLLLAHSA